MRAILNLAYSALLAFLALISNLALELPDFGAQMILETLILAAALINIPFDLSHPSGIAAGKATGFLHSLSGTEPPDPLVTPLNLKFWRGACGLNDDLYRRLERTGAVVQYVLSDGFQNPTPGGCLAQGDRDVYPHEDPQLWRKHVQSEWSRINANKWKVIWEPWNEPDYWRDSAAEFYDPVAFAQYLDAFRVAYEVVRALDPKAEFAGPSLSADTWAAGRSRLVAFLKYCEENHIEVAHLTWHGFDDWEHMDQWSARIQEFRALAAAHPAVKVKRIVISEIVAKEHFLSPGDLLANITHVDAAGADFVARACHSYDSCWLNELDGAVVKVASGAFRKRSNWWVEYWYASTLGARFDGKSPDKGITAYVVPLDGKLVALVASARSTGPTTARDIVLELASVPGPALRRAIAERVDDRGDGFLDAPLPVPTVRLVAVPGQAKITLPGVRPGDAWRVTLD